MRRLLITIAMTALTIGCARKIQSEVHWREAELPIEHYRDLYNDKTIIIYMSADWDLTGRVVIESLRDDSSLRKLEKRNALSLVYDCTKRDSIGSQEMKKLGPAGYPNSFVVYRPNQDVPEFYRPMHEPDGVAVAAQKIIGEILRDK